MAVEEIPHCKSPGKEHALKRVLFLGLNTILTWLMTFIEMSFLKGWGGGGPVTATTWFRGIKGGASIALRMSNAAMAHGIIVFH